MEKLTVIYHDKSQLKVSNKREGSMLSYFYRKVGFKPSIKSAIIQRYPKKKHKPMILISNGIPAVNDTYLDKRDSEFFRKREMVARLSASRKTI